jgi:hypothetical protein
MFICILLLSNVMRNGRRPLKWLEIIPIPQALGNEEIIQETWDWRGAVCGGSGRSNEICHRYQMDNSMML